MIGARTGCVRSLMGGLEVSLGLRHLRKEFVSSFACCRRYCHTFPAMAIANNLPTTTTSTFPVDCASTSHTYDPDARSLLPLNSIHALVQLGEECNLLVRKVESSFFSSSILQDPRCRIQQQVQLLWECKRDNFDFYVTRCAAPQGVNVDGAPTFSRKRAHA